MILEGNEKGNLAFDLSELKFPVKITNYDVQTAQQQFHQFSQGLKISSSRAEYFNQTGLATYRCKRIDEKQRPGWQGGSGKKFHT
jgi:hypothetical protein